MKKIYIKSKAWSIELIMLSNEEYYKIPFLTLLVWTTTVVFGYVLGIFG